MVVVAVKIATTEQVNIWAFVSLHFYSVSIQPTECLWSCCESLTYQLFQTIELPWIHMLPTGVLEFLLYIPKG